MTPAPAAFPGARLTECPRRKTAFHRYSAPSLWDGLPWRGIPDRTCGVASRVLHLCADASFWQFADKTLGKLSEAGFEVHAASSAATKSQHLAPLPQVTVHDLPLSRSISLAGDLRALAVTSALLRRLKPDLVHAHTPKGGLIGMLAARLSGVERRIYHAHGLRYQSARGTLRRLLFATERTSCAGATTVVCVSPSVQAALVDDGLLHKRKTRLLHHGSAQGMPRSDPAEEAECAAEGRRILSRLGITGNGPRAVFVGRLCRDKGVARLPDIWRGVQKRLPDAQLIIVGAPDPTDPVDLRPLEQAGGIHCLGHREDVRPVLLTASVLLLPSSREGLPQCVLEAASLGIPSLVSDVTGCVDSVLPGRTGLVLPLDGTPDWVDAVVRILQDRPLAIELGRCARAWVSDWFDPDPSFQALLGLYEELGLRPGA